MKSLAILWAVFLSMSMAYAQLNYEPSLLIWDSVSVEEDKMKFLEYSEVEVTTFQVQKNQRRAPISREIRSYDKEGYLNQMVKLERRDTSMVQQYHYSRGKLGWTETEDRVWNRSYVKQVRLTSHKAPYQIKSYELLNNDQRLLLGTRQYIYDKDSSLIAIRILENRQIVQTHRFEYDQDKMLVKETFEDAQSRVMEEVAYRYDMMGFVQQVVINKAGVTDVYTYQYDEKGLPIQALWKRDGLTKGLVSYQYNQSGLITEVKQITDVEQPSEHQLVKVVSYK